MQSQMYVARSIVEPRVRDEQNSIWLRDLQLARAEARAERRARRGRL